MAGLRWYSKKFGLCFNSNAFMSCNMDNSPRPIVLTNSIMKRLLVCGMCRTCSGACSGTCSGVARFGCTFHSSVGWICRYLFLKSHRSPNSRLRPRFCYRPSPYNRTSVENGDLWGGEGTPRISKYREHNCPENRGPAAQDGLPLSDRGHQSQQDRPRSGRTCLTGSSASA